MRVLIADDSVISRRLLESALQKWGYEAVTVADGRAAWEILQSPNAPRLAVLDWMMPGYTGLEVCRMVRENNAEPYTYLLLLTSRSDKEDLVEGMNAGADDYLAKPFDQQELRVRLHAGRRIVELQDELLKAREALRIQATHDGLTGLKNRAMIMECLGAEMARSERERVPFGLILMDIDAFKAVNDTYGHAAGDAVLCELARRLPDAMRPYDTVGRYGGEEFIVLLPGCDAKKTMNQAERLRRTVAEMPIVYNDQPLRITASFGATVWSHGSTQDALVQCADESLYKAKNGGRNCVVFGVLVNQHVEPPREAAVG